MINLRCTHLNIRSIITNFDAFVFFVKRNNFDIIFVTETWLNSLSQYPLGELSQIYNIHRCDRLRRKGGGVSIIVRSIFQFHEIRKECLSKAFEYICGDIYCMNRSIRVACVYRTPSCDSESSKILNARLSDLINSSTANDDLIIAGDFNYSDIDWRNMTGNAAAGDFVSMIKNFGLRQVITAPTRGTNILDLVIVNSNICRDVYVGQKVGNSDHRCVLFDLSIQKAETVWKYKKIFSQTNFDYARAQINSIDFSKHFDSMNTVDECYEFLLDVLHRSVGDCVPTLRVRADRSLLPQYLVDLDNRRMRLWETASQTNLQPDWDEYNLFCQRFNKKIKKFNRSIENKILLSSDQKGLYRYMRSKTKGSSVIAALKSRNGEMVFDDKEKSELLADVFASVFTLDDGTLPEVNFNCRKVCPAPSAFTELEIEESIRLWPSSHALTPDKIPNSFMKGLSIELSRPLCYVFNRCLFNADVPKRWKHSFVSPIPKKSPLSQPINYRPVSLTCFTARVFEKHLLADVIDHLERNDIISSAQHGFRKGYSRETQMLECLNDWTLANEENKSTDVMYLDFSKAFDRVSHEKLLHKLKALSFHPMILTWVSEFLSGRTFQVRVGDVFSQVREVTSGVPQGGVLSPTLFSIYTYEVPFLTKGLNAISKVYADDTKLYQSFDHGDNMVLQEALKRVIEWSHTWQLPLAAEKTQVLHIGKENPQHDYVVDGNVLESVEVIRDLGFYITKDLTFGKHISIIVQKAIVACHTIFRVIKTKNRRALLRAYKCYVRPIVESATTVFSPTKLEDVKILESVQNRFTKWLYVREKNYEYSTIPSPKRRNKLYELDSLACRRLRRDLIMVYNIIHGYNGLNCKVFFIRKKSRTRGYDIKIALLHVRKKSRRSFFVNRAGTEYQKIEREGILFASPKSFIAFVRRKYKF